MISVHIISKPEERTSERYYKCLESLKGEPVNVVHADYIDGVGNARVSAIQRSHGEWISWIDPDDYVIDHGFSVCWNLISANPNCSAVYTNHWIAEKGKIIKPWFHSLASGKGFSQCVQMHHLVVYRKSIIEKEFEYMKDVNTIDKKLFNLASISKGKVIGTDKCYYMWNKDGNQNHLRYTINDNPRKWLDRVNYYKRKIRGKI